MPRQSGVTTARRQLQPPHLKRLSLAMVGKSVSSGNAITSKGTDSDRWQSRHVAKMPWTPMALRRAIVGGFVGSAISEAKIHGVVLIRAMNADSAGGAPSVMDKILGATRAIAHDRQPIGATTIRNMRMHFLVIPFSFKSMRDLYPPPEQFGRAHHLRSWPMQNHPHDLSN